MPLWSMVIKYFREFERDVSELRVEDANEPRFHQEIYMEPNGGGFFYIKCKIKSTRLLLAFYIHVTLTKE